LLKPVTFLPITNESPFGALAFKSTAGAWQTVATGFPGSWD